MPAPSKRAALAAAITRSPSMDLLASVCYVSLSQPAAVASITCEARSRVHHSEDVQSSRSIWLQRAVGHLQSGDAQNCAFKGVGVSYWVLMLAALVGRSGYACRMFCTLYHTQYAEVHMSIITCVAATRCRPSARFRQRQHSSRTKETIPLRPQCTTSLKLCKDHTTAPPDSAALPAMCLSMVAIPSQCFSPPCC